MLGNSIGLLTLALMLASEGRHTTGVWRYGLFTLATVVALVAVALQPIADRLPSVGTTLSAVFGSPLSWFLLFMGLFFVLRPFWQKAPAAKDALTSLPFLTHAPETEVEAGIRTRLEKVEQEIETSKLVSQRETELARDLKGMREAVDLANSRIMSVDRYVKSEFEGVAARIEDEKKQRQSSFAALQIREILADLAVEIERDAADLYDRLHAGEVYDQAAWERWENVHHHWVGLMDRWLHNAQWYAATVPARVKAIPDAKFGGKWSIKDSQFPATEDDPASEKVRRFKKFRIIQTQWEEVRGDVDRGICSVAFGGLTESEARGEGS